MENSPNEEQEAEYKLIRDNFQKKRDELNISINKHKLVFEEAKKTISNLEKEIENSRPVIGGCDKHMVCKKCDIYSMKYMGSTPNPDKYHIHECVICGFEDSHT
jgi:hypothetical protein